MFDPHDLDRLGQGGVRYHLESTSDFKSFLPKALVYQIGKCIVARAVSI
jgi:hypothetical protein